MNPWRLFTQHPESVGETYLQHLRQASAFALGMWVGGAACLIHAVFPFLFVRTGGNWVSKLHQRMTSRSRDSVVPDSHTGFER
jgi:Family of unknown function (DUF6356)